MHTAQHKLKLWMLEISYKKSDSDNVDVFQSQIQAIDIL